MDGKKKAKQKTKQNIKLNNVTKELSDYSFLRVNLR